MVNESVTDVNGNIDPHAEVNGNHVEPPPAPTEASNGISNGAANGNGATSDPAPEATYTKLDVCFLCAEPATFTCDKCGLVAFCSEAHQKLHRPENFCFPFMVEQMEGVGR